MNKTILISDLHLSEQTAALNQLFFSSLKNWQREVDALYVLGDFFDMWLGDDDNSEWIDTIKQALHEFTRHAPLYFIHGNRDFLLGEAFAGETGIQILTAPYHVVLYGCSYVFTHGDELCTDDLAYQQFRRQSRNPVWQMFVLGKSLDERRVLAEQIRQMSETRKNQEGKSEISDVTEAGIQALMQDFAAQETIPTLVHGHTHRPAQHQHCIDGKKFQRCVIPDWYDGGGGYLQISPQGMCMYLLKAP